MIPDIEDIVDGLIAGTMSREQALQWLSAHMQMAGDDESLVDGFAMGIIEGVHANRGRTSEESHLCAYAWRLARRMVETRATVLDEDDEPAEQR